MDSKIKGTGKEFVISLIKQYLPNATLVDEQITIPVKGKQGLWIPGKSVIQKIESQLNNN